MQRLAGRSAMRAAHSGCLIGAGWIYFRASSSLSGIVLFGRPDRAEAEALAHALELEFLPGVGRHVFFVDAQRLEVAEPDAFERLVEVYRRNRTLAAERYKELVLCVPPGLSGAVVAGFHGGLPPPYPVFSTSDADEASTRAGLSADDRARLLEIVAAQRGVPPIVAALHTRLSIAPDEGEDALARALGLSKRTLQRRLREAGTSLEREVFARRIEEAKQRLVSGDTPVTTIALDLGFATSQHFSRLFRAATGLAPSEFRARARSPRPVA